MASNSVPEEPSGKTWVDVVKTDVEGSAADENLDATHGFTRPEMAKKKPLVGSVDLYERHVFLRYNQPSSWPSKVEAADYDPLPSKLVSALRSKKNELSKKTRLTIADGQDEPEKTNGDILVFPDMMKYKGIAESDIESFVDEVLVKGQMWALGEPEPLVGSYVFICAHGSRDKRCGVCGPPLKERFNKEVGLRGLGEQVFVNYCSHIGGHKYAGNVIVFRRDNGSGDVSGHWYGYVTPEDVPEILEKHIGLGQVVDRLWRGQMGLTEEQQKEVQQKRSPGMEKPPSGAEREKADKAEGKRDATATANGESVLEKVTVPVRKPIPTLLPRIGSRDLHQMCGDEREEEGPLKPYAEKKKPRFKLPVWIEDWETGDTLAVVSLATAVAGIYLAYNVYRSQHQS
ncbi:hypothetical protein M758_8G140900 [Ceratodon purpureus]|nr:hypothetical protein M758_8G140900 [Ceratodon purpureus]